MLIEDAFLISLNSSYATSLNGTYNSDVIFPFNGILKDDETIAYIEISVLNAQIPVSFFGVNSTNNILNYQVLSVNYSITITQGNYNSSTFITELQTQFSKNAHSFTITLNNNSGILTFSLSNSFSFLLSSTCVVLFGFTTTLNSVSNSLTMSYPMNLIGQTMLKIVSKSLPTRNYDANNTFVLATIAVDVPSYGLITWENTTNHRNLLNIKIINNISIQIYDQNNNLINFNNATWNITIRVGVFRNIVLSSSKLEPQNDT